MAQLEGLRRSGKEIDHVAVEVGGPKPGDGAIRFTGCAVGGSVDSETFLACKRVVMAKLDRVPSLLTV